ncbi:ABC transporter ATP-binding protein [Stenotrophomonas sp. GD03908]|uniref:ABC transporter ATP-binding protein n=1 Tax=Stenotrophomonas maltophilia TaxID=40324 RepID=A0AAJ2TN79_STEMA|nr:MULTISPECIES: ABC transporter ATP-binding protein [Stenotrophomonas]MBH1482452.1 ABC transporter ATP-binding protein [Stenotrophomonas maltophilia]MCU1064272.1 ABC transporter ATP-binding protein [Stenotrophomonas maltophilia]MDH0980510.1 ABC transporter ATP-binding protein [Stenotrophomonas sp. GD03908]MDQ7294679.1 ABC transporter ATP-binding protein [Stenotrophomonas sp. Sm0041]MDZ5766189.1 ABC transporter ATP-binding protein [Stenotrophomonas maltophilia]
MDPIAPSLARLQQVQVRYRDHTALHGIDLQVRAGQVLALLGRNGAGKSTAISVLLGLRRADAGQVELLGGDPQQRASRLGLGVMLQSTSLPPMLQVDELVAQASACYPDPMPLQEVLQRAGLQALSRRRYGQLSGGQQRAVQFAIALCGRPRVLFLDEPTTGLDIQARQTMWQAIRQLVAEGCGVLLTTHYLEEAEALAQQVVVLEKGRVLADAPLSELRLADRPRRIRCRSVLPAEDVQQWPGVQQAQRDGEHLQLLASPAEPVVARLLAADALLRELEVQGAALADAFLDLTQEAA